MQALEDDAVRERVALDDFSALPGLSLSELERATVRAIADKPPFVYAGYRFLRRWTTSSSRSGPGDRFNAVTALADAPALAAFDRLRRALAADDSPRNVARRAFGRGEVVDAERLGSLLGTEAVGSLLRTGALQVVEAESDGDGPGLRAQVGILVAGEFMVVIPPQVEEQGDLAYFGGDSIGLLERAWPLATGGRLAIELGTGTGFLAAALAPRYELVIATELLRSSASVAALTFRLNDPGPGSRAVGWRCASPTWRVGYGPAAPTSSSPTPRSCLRSPPTPGARR